MPNPTVSPTLVEPEASPAHDSIAPATAEIVLRVLSASWHPPLATRAASLLFRVAFASTIALGLAVATATVLDQGLLRRSLGLDATSSAWIAAALLFLASAWLTWLVLGTAKRWRRPFA